MKPKNKTPKPAPLSMWEWGGILAIVVFLCISARVVLSDWAENRKVDETPILVTAGTGTVRSIPRCSEVDAKTEEKEYCVPAGGTIVKQLRSAHHHTHTKDAAETAKLRIEARLSSAKTEEEFVKLCEEAGGSVSDDGIPNSGGRFVHSHYACGLVLEDHGKDAAETARLNHAMNVQHGVE